MHAGRVCLRLLMSARPIRLRVLAYNYLCNEVQTVSVHSWVESEEGGLGQQCFGCGVG